MIVLKIDDHREGPWEVKEEKKVDKNFRYYKNYIRRAPLFFTFSAALSV